MKEHVVAAHKSLNVTGPVRVLTPADQRLVKQVLI